MILDTGSAVAGRACPLHYRYRPTDLAAQPPAFSCDTLYVVGGLYGNVRALDTVLELFDAEPALNKRLVFNGDFHWFDVDRSSFERINGEVARFDAIRGNVETEIADPLADDSAGCGCGYPDWVGDGVVERSNRIIRRLRATAQAFPGSCEQLRRLPMWLKVLVGNCRVGVVHGDAHSLAGWDFAPEALADPAHRARLPADFDAAQVDVFASTHTCSPVLHRWGSNGQQILVNNGAAGMPNLAGEAAGLLTRIATTAPIDGRQSRAGLCRPDGICIDLLAIGYDDARWRRDFCAAWPPGSDAHDSYWRRISGQGGVAGPIDGVDR
ncbi:metallophosphoesterase family protein [Piscinibacter sakaiensis]|uniref:metallophosphoesterase family protein n=1 Tax=Piscinibacter sakaiensis TaxID=1547922 RepID=UPI003AB08098